MLFGSQVNFRPCFLTFLLTYCGEKMGTWQMCFQPLYQAPELHVPLSSFPLSLGFLSVSLDFVGEVLLLAISVRRCVSLSVVLWMPQNLVCLSMHYCTTECLSLFFNCLHTQTLQASEPGKKKVVVDCIFTCAVVCLSAQAQEKGRHPDTWMTVCIY